MSWILPTFPVVQRIAIFHTEDMAALVAHPKPCLPAGRAASTERASLQNPFGGFLVAVC